MKYETNRTQTAAMSHVADWAYGPQFAILSAFHSTLIPAAVVEKLNNFQGEHIFTSSAFSPPFDIYSRNITAWLAQNISIGAESFNETTIGGPAKPSEYVMFTLPDTFTERPWTSSQDETSLVFLKVPTMMEKIDFAVP